jgi:hypothetical protein
MLSRLEADLKKQNLHSATEATVTLKDLYWRPKTSNPRISRRSLLSFDLDADGQDWDSDTATKDRSDTLTEGP